MDKQQEYELRQAVSKKIICRVERCIQDYYDQNKNNIGALIYYPLIKLEERFREVDPEFPKVEHERVSISWFLREMLKKISFPTSKFLFKEPEYKQFERMYEEIIKMYNDYCIAETVTDMRSISKQKLVEERDYVRLLVPILKQKYNKESIYYWRIGEEEKASFEEERSSKVLEYLIKEYPVVEPDFRGGLVLNGSSLKRLRKLNIYIDETLLDFCRNRVEADLIKLGENVKSNVFQDVDCLKNIIGFLFYIGQATHYQFQTAKLYGPSGEFPNSIVVTPRNWLVRKISRVFGYDIKLVEQYLDYFSLDANLKGTITEFPLLCVDNNFLLIPSSVMLNDWHITLVNGHYYKNINFVDKQDSISQSIIEEITKKAKRYSNILYTTNKYYEFEDKGDKVNSDIDVALYDSVCNKLLVIECKWKENIYLSDEDYIKLTDTVNKIYSKQLSKHKKFLESECDYALAYLFPNYGSEENNPNKIFYLAVDKRSQLHFDNKHMVSLYMLLLMFDRYETEGTLQMAELIKEINELETSVEYDEEIDDETILTCGEKRVSLSRLRLNYE